MQKERSLVAHTTSLNTRRAIPASTNTMLASAGMMTRHAEKRRHHCFCTASGSSRSRSSTWAGVDTLGSHQRGGGGECILACTTLATFAFVVLILQGRGRGITGRGGPGVRGIRALPPAAFGWHAGPGNGSGAEMYQAPSCELHTVSWHRLLLICAHRQAGCRV